MENHIVFMGKSTIYMAMFNSKLLVYQRVVVVELWETYKKKNSEWIHLWVAEGKLKVCLKMKITVPSFWEVL